MSQTSPTAYPALPSGNDPLVLLTLPRWNWGAFCLTWIWVAGHSMPLVTFVALLFMGTFPIPNLLLGFFGNELAWRYRPFDSPEEFRKVQAAWTKWGIIVFVVMVLLVPAVAGFLWASRIGPGPVMIRH